MTACLQNIIRFTETLPKVWVLLGINLLGMPSSRSSVLFLFFFIVVLFFSLFFFFILPFVLRLVAGVSAAYKPRSLPQHSLVQLPQYARAAPLSLFACSYLYRCCCCFFFGLSAIVFRCMTGPGARTSSRLDLSPERVVTSSSAAARPSPRLSSLHSGPSLLARRRLTKSLAIYYRPPSRSRPRRVRDRVNETYRHVRANSSRTLL